MEHTTTIFSEMVAAPLVHPRRYRLVDIVVMGPGDDPYSVFLASRSGCAAGVQVVYPQGVLVAVPAMADWEVALASWV